MALIFGLAIGVRLLAVPLALAAEETHVFDPVRSLTGNCSTSPADLVPDPGLCPIPPGIPGVDHPSSDFSVPRGVTTDRLGDIYVSSSEDKVVDIFGPTGHFISELETDTRPIAIAVDSEGTLYVRELDSPKQIVRCTPTVYEPEVEKIEYGPCVVAVPEETAGLLTPTTNGIAVNPLNDHLFVHYENLVAEFGSAEEGNPLLDKTIGEGTLQAGQFMAVDATAGRIYASDSATPALTPSTVRVFELAPPHALLKTITGCDEDFVAVHGNLLVAADEESHHFFVADMKKARVYEFTEGGECIATVEHSFKDAGPSAIAVDNSTESANLGYLFVTSGSSGVGHSYAFAPVSVKGPGITASVGEVAEAEAQLQATIDAGSAEAEYVLEYTTREEFETKGFEGGTVAAQGTVPPNTEGFIVNATASGLDPGTEYVLRAQAQSKPGEGEVLSDEDEVPFGTFPEVVELGQPCPNEALRTGASASLPDCRDYELVTPPDTNGHIPRGGAFNGAFFNSPWASPQGDAASFTIEGGTLPGFEGTGSFNGENYLVTRTSGGWQTEVAGPNGTESEAALPGSPSPDQGYSFWIAPEEEGSAAIEGKETTYVRYPDGHSALVGRGSLATAPRAQGLLITEGGGNIVFSSASASGTGGGVPRLEPNSPPAGTPAIYDRTADEITHVVSLLPEDQTPAGGEGATYLGASANGAGIAFQIGSAIYLRLDNQKTFKVAEGATFAGVSEGGGRVFYLEGGDLFAFDTASEGTLQFSESGDVTVVNVAAAGTRAYFVSPSKLTGEEESEAAPNGQFPVSAAENLYLSEGEGELRFLGTLTERDVKGDKSSTGEEFGGLGLWVQALKKNAMAIDPSRTTPAGDVLLFESRAELTDFGSAGKAEVYRYEEGANTLTCLSCEPARKEPSADASLQSLAGTSTVVPLMSVAFVPALTPDGRRVFFQTSSPMVASDTDGLQDIYEWEEEGVGSCKKGGGCTYLISSAHSERPEYLYGMSDDGSNVFFSTSDQLLPGDTGAAASLYDARVGGGFAEVQPTPPCEGEGCRPVITPAPAVATPPSQGSGSSGNVQGQKKSRRCSKGKHSARRGRKNVCVKDKKHHRRRRAGK